MNNNFQDRLGRLKRASAANGSGAPFGSRPAQAPAMAAKRSNPVSSESSLENLFLELAEIKSFRDMGFGKNASMDDPIGFLNQKSNPADPNSRYRFTNEMLSNMISSLLVKGRGRSGTPLDQWMRAHNGGAIETAFEHAIQKGLFDRDTTGLVTKALDSTNSSGVGGGVLVRTDLDPIIRIAYLRNFPANDVIRKIPSNGLVHTYNTVSDPGEAVTVSELGDLGTAGADTNSTFNRKTSTNIAIIATRRGISLKLQFAVSQSGMGSAYDLTGPNNIEVMNAITAIARKNQSLFLQGNQTDAAGTLNNESGLYDVNAYDGLRHLLSGSTTSLTKGSTQTTLDAIDQAVAEIGNAGGNLEELVIMMSYGAKRALNADMQQFYRVFNAAPDEGFSNSLSANGVVTVSDFLSKIVTVPADAQNRGIGYYSLGGSPTEDIYVIDPQGLAFPYLGSADPVILELPVGYNGQLSNVYIPFVMNGLMVDVPQFQRKVRIPQQTV